MSDYSVRIERAENGFKVCLRDPKIVEENNSRSGKMESSPWKDPERQYVFSDFKKMAAFLQKNLEKALPKSEYENSFDEAVAKED